ncbi:transposase [Priestia megaterium]|nr:transposase [Priestia megaterium]
MKNWQEEICNYHSLRFTNAVVEGKNNKIKALQRRHYFTRNPNCYKQRISLCLKKSIVLNIRKVFRIKQPLLISKEVAFCCFY